MTKLEESNKEFEAASAAVTDSARKLREAQARKIAAARKRDDLTKKAGVQNTAGKRVKINTNRPPTS